VVIAFIGLAMVVISISFGKGVDLAAVSFGLACTLYGIRLLAETHTVHLLFDVPPIVWEYVYIFITYVIMIPSVLFVEQILGKGWKSSIRGVLLIQVAYAAVAIPVDSFLGVPGALELPNGFLAIFSNLVILAHVFSPGLALARRDQWVLRAGYLMFALTVFANNLAWITLTGESVGFLVFLCCLGDVVLQRTRRNEKQLVAIQQELETAHRIQSTILPDKMPQVAGLDLAVRYVPMSEVAGDFYDFLAVDEKRVGMLVADVSGHGIPAALIASMVKVAFSAQAERAEKPAQVLTEMNRIFCGKMKSQFVTAGYIYVDTEKGKLSYSTAGHPPLLVWRHSEEKVHEIKLSGMLMGHLRSAEYVTAEVAVAPGDRVILYTDGIVETTNRVGDFFGKERLLQFIENNRELTAANFADALLEHICDWTARKLGDGGFDDDLTLLVVNVGENSKKSRKEI
jgi:serine phosphatase RsbU (regulator of sigma subunit)